MLRLFFGFFLVCFVAIAAFEMTTTGAIGNLPASLLRAIDAIITFCSTFQIMS